MTTTTRLSGANNTKTTTMGYLPAVEILTFLRQKFGEPIRCTSDALVNAARMTVPGSYAKAPLDEAERQIARLNSLRSATDGWAGPGSVAPSVASLNEAIEMLRRIKTLPVPVPMASVGSHGNAGLFWSDESLYADLELLGDGRIGYLIHVNGAPSIDSEEDLPAGGLPPKIATALATAYFSNR